MNDDDLSYKDLRRLHQLEKRSSAIAQLRNDFYIKVMDYIKELEQILDNADSPQKRKLIEDELKNARQAFREIYELREKKIVLAALSKVRGGNPDLRNLIHEETVLFEMLVDVLKTARDNTLIDKKTEDSSPQTYETEPINKKVDEKEANHHEEVKKEDNEERTVVLMKKNLPTFVGINMKRYTLRENDVISMPLNMGETLEKRGAAEKVR
ncbi:MAG TPA: DNA replication complex GINS family protein [Thermoplasmatales archaeon]|nr:DNA replication complex GINS family protein [Thermoplasmatales archaeon]